jgi:predicted small integral membrane protein
MMIERLAKIIMSGGLAILCALIAFGNIHDPEPNYRFVQHVLSMDTISPGATTAARAMPIPMLWRVSFWSIVAGEVVAAVFFVLGTAELARARNAKAWAFQQAKRFIYLGAVCAFLIWFVGFTAVGGEWFAMWMSDAWNGQQAAFRTCVFILLVLIFVAEPDPELAGRDFE